MDNSNSNNHFISPNRFETKNENKSFYENNNDDDESVRNNIDSTKTLQNDHINKFFWKV